MKTISTSFARFQRYYGNTSLGARIAFGALLLVLAATLLEIILIGKHERDQYLIEFGDRQALQGRINGTELKQAIDGLRRDALFLVHAPPMTGIIQAAATPDGEREGDRWMGLLQQGFTAFMAARSSYYQLRLIGVADQGRELLRVQRHDGQPQSVPPEQLRQHGDHDYFKSALTLEAGAVLLSEFEINREHGEVQRPHVRTLRAATQIRARDGSIFGLVIIHMEVGPLLDRFALHAREGIDYYLLNDRGDYLVHPDQGKTFGFDLGSARRWQDDHPGSPVTASVNGAPHRLTSATGTQYASYYRIPFDDQRPERFLTLVSTLSEGLIQQRIAGTQGLVIVISMLVSVLLGALFLYHLRRSLSPLKQLTLAAGKIGAGQYDTPLPAIEGGEVGALVQAFRRMQQRIDAHNQEVRQANEELARSEAYANLIIDTVPEAILVADANGVILRVNRRAEQVFGYPLGQLLGQSVELLIPERLRQHHALLRRDYAAQPKVRETGGSQVLSARHRDGRELPVEIGLAPMLSGALHYVIISITDVSARMAAEALKQRDREQQSTLRSLLETTLSGYGLEETLAKCLDQLLAVSWLSLLPKGGVFLMEPNGEGLRLAFSHDLAPEIRALCAQVPLGHCLCGRAAASGQMQYAHCVDERHEIGFPGMTDHGHYSLPLLSNNELMGVLVLYLPLGFQRDGHKEQFLASVSDILAGYLSRKRQEESLRRSAAVLESTHEGVMVTDLDTRIIMINPAFTEITGYSEAEILGNTPVVLHSDRQDTMYYQQLWASVHQAGFWQGEIWNRRKNGDIYPEWLSISAIRDEQGSVVNYVGVFSDISQIKDAEQRLAYLAHHDALTGLPNRLMMQTLLGHALNRARRESYLVALLFMDLDRFKNVNDSLGHAAGDELLRIAAQRLQERVRGSDTVARLGGDEFVILLEEPRDAATAANVAQDVIEIFRVPVRLSSGQEVYVGTSIGISLFPNDGDAADALVRNADSAMYQAKEAGRNTYRFYTEALTQRAEQRLRLEGRLRRALEQGEMLLHYQPLITGGRCAGVEALVRWQDAEEGLVSPAQFIPLAEETRLIIPLGDWVLRTACAQMKAWRDAGLALHTLAVNLSPIQCQQADFVEALRAILEETGLDPSRLELEITEGTIMRQAQESEAKLAELRELGVRIAIDDFGTGYSSLAYLKRFSIHKLKIDQSFVRDIPGNPASMEITATIIAMAKNLKIEVLAEGVETPAQLDYLKGQDCDSFQGYLFSRPLPPEQIPGFLSLDFV